MQVSSSVAKLSLLFLLGTNALIAQSTFGSFVGTVHDPSGAAIAGCKITAKNTATEASRTTLTEANGDYNIVNLEPGTYQISMETPGFQRSLFTNLELDSRQTIRVNGKLLVATQSNTVNVEAVSEAPINTEGSSIAESKLGRRTE